MPEEKSLSFEEKSDLFKKTVASVEDREAHAASFGELILLQLPSEASVRSIYTVDVLPAGASPLYTIDIGTIDAWVLPKMGEHPLNLVTAEEVTIPTFEVTGDVTYKIQFARDGRFNVAERARLRLLDSIVDLEESAGWTLLRAACTAANTVTNVAPDTGLSKALISAAKALMESNRGYRPDTLYVSSNRAADIRDWEYTKIDQTTMREIFVDGGLGSIWNVNINVVWFLADDEAYMFDSRDNKLGYMPIRDQLRTYDDPTAIKKYRVGVIAYEEIGFGVLDTKCIVKLDIA
jgi:hypothetical protein